jgi:hypothetical protein
MGNYRRSPMCRHCYQRGHTKNHCPEIKEAAANGEWWAKELIEKQKQSVKNRKCSYCGEQGHNKRSCNYKKVDKVIYDMVGKDFVEERLKEMKANGVAVGSLISYVPSYGNRGTTTIAYVTKIVTENRSPTWRWLEKYFHEKPDGYTGYNRYERSMDNSPRQDVVFLLKSVTGTGLGYWGDSELCSVEYEDFERELRKGTPANMKVVG